jgi:hypothetical protein
MRAIIIAAGEATRWDNYLGIPKHFAKLNGEPLLERTIRLLKNEGLTKDEIIVVSHDYKLDTALNYRPDPQLHIEYSDASKFLDSTDLWDKAGRTLIIYGDVYFTEKAMHTIVSYPLKDWRLFCRPGRSKHTGTRWGECFAISFYTKDHEKALRELHRIARLKNIGHIDRCGGWEWVRAMHGLPDERIRKPHLVTCPLYFTIDDMTDDIDYPEDYDRLKERLEQRNKYATQKANN